MPRTLRMLPIALISFLAAAGPAAPQTSAAVEDELVLITPVAKTLTDPSLAEFAKFAKEKWNITVKTSALAAGMERPPGGRHFLGRRKRPVRQAGRAEAADET